MIRAALGPSLPRAAPAAAPNATQMRNRWSPATAYQENTSIATSAASATAVAIAAPNAPDAARPVDDRKPSPREVGLVWLPTGIPSPSGGYRFMRNRPPA